jgi:tripartite-type tricarboxylate transporter receptor subunit TctC
VSGNIQRASEGEAQEWTILRELPVGHEAFPVEGEEMTPEDLAALQRAVHSLEHSTLAARFANIVGKPIELVGHVLPTFAKQAITIATAKSLEVALKAAVQTLHGGPQPDPSLPANTVAEFIAYAKANPGKINMASGGTGSAPHVAGELFKMMTQVDLVHVPYHGDAPALVDLMAGQVQVMFDLLSASIGFIKSGKLRALAVTTVTRSEALPDVPTVAETVPGYEASSWQGLGAPKNTPRDVVATLYAAMIAGYTDVKFKAKLTDLGGEPLTGAPTDFGKLIADDTEKWAKVVKFANIKPE